MLVDAKRKRGLGTGKAILISAVGAVLLGVGLVLAWLYVTDWSVREFPFRPGDRAGLLTAEDLVSIHPDFIPVASAEETTKHRYLDGSWLLTYFYQHPDEDWPLHLYSETGVCPDQAAAGDEFTALLLDAGLDPITKGWGEGYTQREQNAGYRFGRKSRHWLIEYEGEPSGHLLIVLQGSRVLYLELDEARVDGPAELEALVRPILDRLPQFDPAE